MRILHLSTFDSRGGAARGALWLHRALLEAGVDSHMLVLEKSTDDETITGLYGRSKRFGRPITPRLLADQAALRLHRHRTREMFTPAVRVPSAVAQKISKLKPDLVNIHWANSGFLVPEDLIRIDAPIVITLRDMWTMTGGCHYADDCTQYTTGCGTCPKLGSGKLQDMSHALWQRKQSAWGPLDLTLVGISNWVAECARNTPFLEDKRVEVIHNAVDTEIFCLQDKDQARKALGLDIDPDQKIIAYGALSAFEDERKGFRYALEALNGLAPDRYQAVFFGADELPAGTDLSIQHHCLGTIRDDRKLASVYAAADVMLVPSIQEAFGKTAIEAMACGTPVVSFDTSGLKDIVQHQETGYRAEPLNAADLKNGILWCVDSLSSTRVQARIRESVEDHFGLARQVSSYVELYQDVLARRPGAVA